MIIGIAQFGSPSQSIGGSPRCTSTKSTGPYWLLKRYRQITATATTVVTTGANSAVRNSGFIRAAEEFSSSAVPSETSIESGTPTTTKYSVCQSAAQNNGWCSRAQ